MSTPPQPLSVAQLLVRYEDYAESVPDLLDSAAIFNFPEEEFANLDVYNPQPFEYEGQSMLIARVEPRDDESRPVSMFFRRESPYSPDWYRVPDLPVFDNLQDPFITVIKNKVVIGGVRLEFVEMPDSTRKITGWNTVIYWADDLQRLELKFVGPSKMKGIRPVELGDGQVGVFTRPQGERGGLGKVGFMKVNNLDDLTVAGLEEAPLVCDLFIDTEWGGVNQAFPLHDGTIGIFGHIARRDSENNVHYFPFSCVFDPFTMTTSEMQLHCTKQHSFPGVQRKRSDLANVLYPGGIYEREGEIRLVSGIADTGSGCIPIKPTFAGRMITKTVRVR